MCATESIEAAKELVKVYRSITLEDLIEAKGEKDYSGGDLLRRITGFGSTNSCILCKVVNEDCTECIHSYLEESNYSCLFDHTYLNIRDASSLEELLVAIRERADYLEKLIEKVNGN